MVPIEQEGGVSESPSLSLISGNQGWEGDSGEMVRSHKSPVLPSLPQYRGAEDMGEAQALCDLQGSLEAASEVIQGVGP